MSEGRLYRSGEDEIVTDIDYRILAGFSAQFSGELIPHEAEDIGDGGDYILEMEDSHRIKCYLRKNVNRPVHGLPARFVYSFIGS